MKRIALRRLITSLITIVTTSIVVFALRFVVPGGPLQDLLGKSNGFVSKAEVTHLKREFGLNHSPIDQYWIWLKALFHGNLGRSYYTEEPVTKILGQALTPSLELIIGALIVAVVVGCGTGMFAAVYSDRWFGRAALALTGLGLSIPDFWMATIAAGVFGLSLGIFPAVGYTTLSEGFWNNIYSIILPILVLSVISGCFLARHLYNSMAETLARPYVRTAWAMGLSPRSVYFKWVLRPAIGPVITFIPLAVAALISGTVLVEDVFNIPGIGTQIVQGVLNQDYNVVQAVVLGAGVVISLLNLATDLLAAAMDPRARLDVQT
jgi:peptide/nickel transport system permease protein